MHGVGECCVGVLGGGNEEGIDSVLQMTMHTHQRIRDAVVRQHNYTIQTHIP